MKNGTRPAGDENNVSGGEFGRNETKLISPFLIEGNVKEFDFHGVPCRIESDPLYFIAPYCIRVFYDGIKVAQWELQWERRLCPLDKGVITDHGLLEIFYQCHHNKLHKERMFQVWNRGIWE